jgi:general secretion pathway protein K
MSPSSTQHRPQRGAALLAAMLTVALVATLAAGALWQQWRSIEVEGAERQRAQARWLLVGALDWARVILREDARADNASTPTDHLAEPWAVPLQEARLSSFLSALPDGTSNRDDDTLAEQVFLSGQINDLQARLNITNLLDGERVDPQALAVFARLFEALNLPPEQLSVLAQGLTNAQRKVNSTSSPLMPQRIDQLTWLGLTPSTLRQLSPHITVLPVRTPVNVNTASAEVLYASVKGLGLADAQRLVQQRSRTHWASLGDFQKTVGPQSSGTSEGAHSVNTRFFEVYGRLRMAHTTVQEHSVLQRDQTEVKVLWREAGQWASAQTPSLQ